MSKNQKDEYYDSKNRKQKDETGEYGKSNDYRDDKKNNRGNNGKSGSTRTKNNYPNRRDSEKTNRNNRVTEGYNAAYWYVPEPVIMQQALSIPFTEFLGASINRGLSANVTGEETYQIPTVMGVYCNPSPGFTKTGAGARDASINRQAKRLYVKLSSRNAKTTNYTPDDIAILLLQIGEIISMVSFAQRTYGLIWNWNIRNKGISDALLRASRINPETISMTPYEYLGRLNSIIFSLNSIVFPMSFSYFEKCAALYSNVFVDSPTRMAQMYIPCPSTTWIIDETGSTGSILKTKTFVGDQLFGTMNASAVLETLEDMVDAVQTSSTFNLIFSDVLKLMEYENVPTMGFKTIPLDYAVVPKFDAEWNIQIMNAKVIGLPATLASPVVGGYTTDNDVVADVTTASVQHAPKFTMRFHAAELDPIVNFFTDVPSDMEKLLATRFYSHAKRKLEGATYVNDPDNTTLTDHYITHIVIFDNDNSGVAKHRWGYTENVLDMNNTLAGLVMCDINKFSFYPITDIVKVDAATKVESYIGILNDLDCFTTLPFNTIRRVNELTQYGLFDPRLKYPGVTQVN